ncbi:uncharacterized protein LOC135465898 [Liolophura sinensis]|uniref:uncharacterized protein LOC135465898 n=1 Tax=Liolophura sinensis TaxID=3198878 RepID=UPI0031589FFF
MSQMVCTCGANSNYQQQQQSGTDQQTQQRQKRPPKPVVAAKDEVYAFIRARREHYPVMKNYMVRESKIIENYKGTIVGLAEKVCVLEAPLGGSNWVSPTTEDPRYCVLVIRFDSMRNANLWSFSDPIFKQQDCLPPNEMIEGFIVPMKHLPPDDCKTFTMMNIRNVRDAQAFQECYIDEVVPLLDDNNVEQGVVSTDEVQPLRRSWVKRGDFIFVHQARRPDSLINVFNSEAYSRLRADRENWAECETLMFTVSREPFRSARRR